MEYEYEINLLELCKYILKRWKIVLISSIVFCLLAVGYSVLKTKTYYMAESVIVVESEDAKTPVQNTNIINREDVVLESLKKIGSSTSVNTAIKNTSISRYNYSKDIKITYSSLNEAEATTFLKALVNNSVNVINGINGYQVVIKEYATSLGSYTSGPSKVKMAVVGTVIGGGFVALLIAVKYVLDNKLRDKNIIEDVFKYKILADYTGDEICKELFANILLGFKSKKVIAISGFQKDASNIAKKFADYIAQVKGSVLFICEGESDTLGDLFCYRKLPLKENADNLLCLTYNSVDRVTDQILNREFSDYYDELKKQFDYIIMCTPAENTDHKTVVLNAISDGTVLIVKKDETKIRDIVEFKKQLDIISAEVIGVIYQS